MSLSFTSSTLACLPAYLPTLLFSCILFSFLPSSQLQLNLLTLPPSSSKLPHSANLLLLPRPPHSVSSPPPSLPTLLPLSLPVTPLPLPSSYPSHFPLTLFFSLLSRPLCLPLPPFPPLFLPNQIIAEVSECEGWVRSTTKPRKNSTWKTNT